MKKILILIVGIAIYLHFYPQEELTQYYEDKKAELMTKLSQSTKVSFTTNLHNIYEELKAEYIGFSSAELAEIKAVTRSVDHLTEFHQKVCLQGQASNTPFHPDNLDKVCQKITQFINTM